MSATSEVVRRLKSARRAIDDEVPRVEPAAAAERRRRAASGVGRAAGRRHDQVSPGAFS